MKRRLAFLSIGEFGDEVAEEAWRRCGQIGSCLKTPQEAEQGQFVALVAPRPVPQLALQLDSLRPSLDLALLPIWMCHGVLEVGPLLIGASPPCFACYGRRRRQHAPDLPFHDATTGYQSAHLPPRKLASGSPIVRLAAQEALRLWWVVLEGEGIGGEVVRLGVPPSAPQKGRVIPIDGCERCWPITDWGSRGWRRLREGLR